MDGYIDEVSKPSEAKTNGINDLDLANWKDYDDLWVDSLWIIDERDKSGAHSNIYHGNFVPQIPHQFIRRFSKENDVILDVFLGSGTTLIEAQRLNRHGIGVELLPEVAKLAESAVKSETTKDTRVIHRIIQGDSRDTETSIKVIEACKEIGKEKVSLIFLHPPYHDIIKFSERPQDLSNCGTVENFLKAFGDIVENFEKLLQKNGHLVIVIGDKYEDSSWIPLGFFTMNEALKRCPNLILKSTIVKNMAGNRAKLNQERLWRYRSLSGGYYVFKHEYIFLLKKTR